MKLLIICNSSTGLLTFRGMLLQKLQQKGNEIVVIAPKSDHRLKTNAEMELKKQGYRLYNISMDRRGMDPIHDLKLFHSYWRIIKNEKPDYIITYTIKCNIYGGICSQLLKIPYAMNITGLGTAFESKKTKKLIITLYKIAVKRVGIVFFENEFNRNVFVESKIVPEKKTCVLNGAGVDLQKFQFIPYPCENQDIHLLFIGRIMKEKGINELYEAATEIKKIYPSVQFDVIGGYEENYKQRTDKLVKTGIINYFGYQEDVRPFIEKCSALILPSYHEGMANTLLEAGAMGRPLITSDIPGCREAVVDKENGFLCKVRDKEALINKIVDFIELPYDKRKEFGWRSYEYVTEKFDKNKVVKETIKELNL